MKKIIIINGPNLNLLGKREIEIYGNQNFESFLMNIKTQFPEFSIDYFQTNIEGEIIDKIQEVGFSYDGIIINAGGYTHTSVAIRDAITSVSSPTVEVHISNIMAREGFRHHSLLSEVCVGLILGFGLSSYTLALQSFKAEPFT